MTAIVTLYGADHGFKVAKCIVFEISLVLWVTLSNFGDFMNIIQVNIDRT